MVPAWRRSSRRKSLSLRVSRLLWTSVSTSVWTSLSMLAAEADAATRSATGSATAVAEVVGAAGRADAACGGTAGVIVAEAAELAFGWEARLLMCAHPCRGRGYRQAAYTRGRSLDV